MKGKPLETENHKKFTNPKKNKQETPKQIFTQV